MPTPGDSRPLTVGEGQRLSLSIQDAPEDPQPTALERWPSSSPCPNGRHHLAMPRRCHGGPYEVLCPDCLAGARSCRSCRSCRPCPLRPRGRPRNECRPAVPSSRPPAGDKFLQSWYPCAVRQRVLSGASPPRSVCSMTRPPSAIMNFQGPNLVVEPSHVLSGCAPGEVISMPSNLRSSGCNCCRSVLPSDHSTISGAVSPCLKRSQPLEPAKRATA